MEVAMCLVLEKKPSLRSQRKERQPRTQVQRWIREPVAGMYPIIPRDFVVSICRFELGFPSFGAVCLILCGSILVVRSDTHQGLG